MEKFINYLQDATGLSAHSFDKLFISIVIILFLWFSRLIILRLVWKNTQNVKTRYQWKRILSFIFPLINIIMIGAVWIRAFEQFGAFLGLFSAGLAIALKDPLTNLAGWFFIVFRKPFVVGDRVQIGENAGDIIDIRLFQFTLLEIGNWVDADQSTGRIIHLPNGKVFLNPQANYSTGFQYIWNEIPVTVTFESDWEKAKSILEEIIQKHAKHFSSHAKKEILEASKNYMVFYKHLSPITYTKVTTSGVTLTIRFLCDPRKRRSLEHQVWEDVLKAFHTQPNIDFAYPTQRFYNYHTEKNTKTNINKDQVS